MKRKFNKEHKDWRKKVLERDNHKCVVCGTGPKYLNVHHLIPSEFKDFEFDVDNGITLCPSHHTLGKFSAHKNPLLFSCWLSNNFSELFDLASRRLADEV